jgi:hypothetical protein
MIVNISFNELEKKSWINNMIVYRSHLILDEVHLHLF